MQQQIMSIKSAWLMIQGPFIQPILIEYELCFMPCVKSLWTDCTEQNRVPTPTT